LMSLPSRTTPSYLFFLPRRISWNSVCLANSCLIFSGSLLYLISASLNP
jgi:hypothetical protein